MVSVGGRPAQQVSVRSAPQAVEVGLAVQDIEVVVHIEGVGPQGPPGPPGSDAITVWEQPDAPVLADGVHTGDFWVKKPPDNVVPQPLFFWTGTEWLPIYGESATGGSPAVPAGGTYSVHGEAITFIGTKRLYNDTGATLTMSKVRLAAGTAPTGADLICDVNKGGTTIFTTQANRPRLTAGQNTSITLAPNVTTWNDGEYLTVDIDQVGVPPAQPGSDLTLTVVCV